MKPKIRRKCRIPVFAECTQRNQQWKGYTRTIGYDGLYIFRAYCFSLNSRISLNIIENGKQINLTGTISRVGMRGSDILFDTLSLEQKRFLKKLMHPEWRHGELLD